MHDWISLRRSILDIRELKTTKAMRVAIEDIAKAIDHADDDAHEEYMNRDTPSKYQETGSILYKRMYCHWSNYKEWGHKATEMKQLGNTLKNLLKE